MRVMLHGELEGYVSVIGELEGYVERRPRESRDGELEGYVER